MEVLTDMPSHKQYLFDAIESNNEVKGLESFGDPSFLLVEPGNTFMLEALSRTGSPNSSLLREMVVLHSKKPISVSNISPLSCQPHIKKSSRGGWKPSTKHVLKKEIGCLLNEELVYVHGSPVFLNRSPELSTSQMYFGNSAIISPSSFLVNNPNFQDSLFIQSYGDGELPYLYGDNVSEEGDLTHPYAKSPVDSNSISLGSSESSTSNNEVLGSSEIQLMNTLFDQSTLMGYTTHDTETWFEDPFSNMATIQSYTNDGCFINDPNIVESEVDDKGETFTHVYHGLKAAHSQGFLGHTDCHQSNNSISLPLNERNEVLNHPRIDFEENFVQSHNLAQEGKILIQGTQFCLPRPISGPSSYGSNLTQKLHVINDGINASSALYTCGLGNKSIDRYTNGRQLNDVHESLGVKPCCSYASEGSIAPQMLTCVKSEDSMDACGGKFGELGSSASNVCRQYDGRLKNDYMEFGLVHFLTAGAEAMARRDMQLASVILVRLKDMVSSLDNTMKRVVSYFVQGLEHQIKGVKGFEHAGSSSKSQGDILAAFQILHEIFPYIKFGHFTANQAILEAVQGAKRVHIVDFEILEGIQWPAFMQALVSRKVCPPELRITALCRPKYEHGLAMAHKTCKRLSEFASALCLPFSYSIVTINNDEEVINASQIEVVEGEALVVNCMVHLPHMPRHTMASVTSFLGILQKFSPSIITLVEEELGCSTTAAASFFSEALYHFHAICDSLEACLPSEVEARMLVERVFMASRIDSAISMWSRTMSPCSVHGVEASHKYKWSSIMHSAGFKPRPLSFHNQSQARLLLGLHKDGFKLEERNHHLVLGWQTKPLYAASVWT